MKEAYIPESVYTDVSYLMHLIATRDSCITRGSEALRNRMCDLNKYIYHWIYVMIRRYCCHPISLSQSLLFSSSSSSSSSTSSLLSHLLSSENVEEIEF